MVCSQTRKKYAELRDEIKVCETVISSVTKERDSAKEAAEARPPRNLQNW